MIDFHWLVEGLGVGAALSPEDFSLLDREHRVGALVDCRSEACDSTELLAQHGLAFLHLPAPDAMGLSQAQLDRGVEWIASRWRRGERVLVHCQHGMGRSALLALCSLVSEGHEPLAAFRLARARREKITLSRVQLETWREWLQRWRSRHPTLPWAVPEFEALSQISWAVSAIPSK